MRRASHFWTAGLGALFASAAFGACTYNFDTLVAKTGSGGAGIGGAAGIGGSGGEAGTDEDAGGSGGTDPDGSAGGAGGTAGTGGAGTGGTSGTGGSGGNAGTDAGQGGNAGVDAGKGGNAGADAGSDRIADVRAETPTTFDCAAVNGTVYQGHCYYPTTTMTNWQLANDVGCLPPSHLAVISNAGEQAVVAAIQAGKDRWIGLRKDPGPPNNEMAFHWVTTEPLTFKSWDSYDTGAPEPNYTGDCVRMRPTNNWGDTPCTDNYVAVCEHE